MTAVRFAIISALVLLAQGCAHRQPQPYFGHIEAPCADEAGCERVRTQLRAMAQCEDDAKCEAGNKLLREVFGVYVPALPKVIVHLDSCSEASGGKCTPADKLSKRTPVLMWDKKRTPHVYGARQIYAMVFAEKKTCIAGSVTNNYRSEPNPLSLILGAVSAVKLEAAQAKPSESKPMSLRWFPLSGNHDPEAPGMWVALGGVPIDENTVSWLTIEPQPLRPKPAAGAPAIPDECIAAPAGPADEVEYRRGESDKENVGARRLFNNLRQLPQGSDATLALENQQIDIRTGQSRNLKPKPDPNAEEEKPKPKPKPPASKPLNADFVAADAFFSNSSGGRATVAIALGGTRGSKDTSLSSGGSNWSYNGYALFKYYLLRPRLRPLPDSACYWIPDWLSTYRCPSIGLFVGTNVKSDVFNEIVYGFSIGHIADNVGIVAGWNSIAGGKNGQEGRQKRPFIGIEYSF